jgi:XTP/dITP diphosphohydrolase
MKQIKKLVLATHNKGKLVEFQALLKPYGIELVSAGDLNLPEPDETGTTFAENAVLKAALASQAASLPALADDSGLCVNALNGQPGLFSARWAGQEKDFAMAMGKINTMLGDNPDRSAYFNATLALSMPDGNCEIFEGVIHGTLVWPPRGADGHGYDPIFVPDGETRTFAEMPPAEKDKISHRAIAFAKLVDSVFKS